MGEPSKSAMTEAWRIYFERCDTVPIAQEFEETEVIDLIARAIDAAKAEEREACAKEADLIAAGRDRQSSEAKAAKHPRSGSISRDFQSMAMSAADVAAAIRKRGEA